LGDLTGKLSAHHTGADFLRFLRGVARAYRRRELHIVLDNSSTHSVPAVCTFLEEHPRIHFHFTPTGASWLNMVEAWFGTLTRRSVRRGSFDTLPALLRHIRAYIAHWNEHPRPSSGPRSRPTSSERPCAAALTRLRRRNTTSGKR
jgi:transposase